MNNLLRRNINRLFAVVLLLGGAFGIVLSAAMALRFIHVHWAFTLFFLVIAAAYAWNAFIGFRLWRGTPYGLKWAPIIFALQIPIADTPWFRYEWFTGAYVGLLLRIFSNAASSSFGSTFAFEVGANYQFNFHIGNTVNNDNGIVIGANVFAIIAFVMLLRSNYSFNRTRVPRAA
jgi:hypothetical protein